MRRRRKRRRIRVYTVCNSSRNFRHKYDKKLSCPNIKGKCGILLDLSAKGTLIHSGDFLAVYYKEDNFCDFLKTFCS